MTPKYVILFSHIFSEKDWKRLGCEEMSQRGYEIKIIQFGALSNLVLGGISRPSYTPIKGAVTPKSKEDVEKILDELTSEDIIMMFLPFNVFGSIYLALSRRKLRYIIRNTGNIPDATPQNLRKSSNIGEYLYYSVIAYKGLIDRYFQHIRTCLKLRFDYFKISGPQFWIRAGTYFPAFTAYAPKYWQAEIIEIESSDLLLTSEIPDNPKLETNRPFAVFIDSAMCDNPDQTIFNLNSLDYEKYHASLRYFFDRIEKELTLEVIIAAHPKSNYGVTETNGAFGDRKVFFGQTAALVKYSKLALIHCSTAVSFISVYQKPAMFLTTNDLEKSIYKSRVASISSWFGQTRINIDQISKSEISRLKIPTVNKKLYANYKAGFLKSPLSRPGSAESVLIKRLKKISNKPANDKPNPIL